ncbi:DNA alkylation repair protein [Nocardia panacis]|uniref:DNA alkylation repair protein n=1 Tax=Nocardia panacis TaxID=2340916 RepID=A0A3A4KC00_9NOCA|nr:DNA alkylation repair protein [Nocardia panacis]RJO77628.1 DNA alkylation repair protein [Nocardia panacis]
MSQGIPLKDAALNAARVTQIAAALSTVHPEFDADGFTAAVTAALPPLGLKQRISCVADYLAQFLPTDFEQAITIILAALPPHDDADYSGSDFGVYTYAPYSDFVARYGCTAQHLETSLTSLREMTKHFSAEDAVRHFINAFPDATMKFVHQWSLDKDYHVRRLASEGTRPVLPWSPRITLEPSAAIPVLDNLHGDSSRFVVMSVANHLNDLSRSDPDLVIATLARWRSGKDHDDKSFAFLTRQALRTLVKGGDPRAFEFLGFATEPAARVSDLMLTAARIPIGGVLEIGFTVCSPVPESVVIDYVVRYPRPSGGYGEAVFKFKTLALSAGQPQHFTRGQHMRPTAGRTLTPGSGSVSIQVNGKRLAESNFELLPAR